MTELRGSSVSGRFNKAGQEPSQLLEPGLQTMLTVTQPSWLSVCLFVEWWTKSVSFANGHMKGPQSPCPSSPTPDLFMCTMCKSTKTSNTDKIKYYFWRNTSKWILRQYCRDDYWCFHKIAKWEFDLKKNISEVDIVTEGVKASIRTARTVCYVQKMTWL